MLKWPSLGMVRHLLVVHRGVFNWGPVSLYLLKYTNTNLAALGLEAYCY